MTSSEMTPDMRDLASDDAAERFTAKWNGVGASELPASQSFLIDLCHLLGVETPHPTPEQSYMFERPITFAYGDGSTSAVRIDSFFGMSYISNLERATAQSPLLQPEWHSSTRSRYSL